jgi:hypothetical protein
VKPKVRLDEHRQKELESQDPKELRRESNRQLRLRTIHRIVHLTRGLLPHLEYYNVHGSELRIRDLS